MTLKELKQYRSICSEISDIEAEIKDKTVRGVVCGSDKDFPYLSHSILVSGVEPNSNNFKILNRLHGLKEKKRAVDDFISAIDDDFTKRIFELRFIKGLSWSKIAFKTSNSEAGVKMICYRYIKNQKN